MGVHRSALSERLLRVLAAALVVLISAVLLVGVAVAQGSTPGLRATSESPIDHAVIPPVVADMGVASPSRVTASDWVTVSKYSFELPAVETRPAGSGGSGSAGAGSSGMWLNVCPNGSAAISPAPPCGWDEAGEPFWGEWVWRP